MCEPQDTFEAVVTRHGPMVYGIALARTHSPQDADDVYQDVFFLYYRRRKGFADDQHRKAWLIRTALNRSKKLLASAWCRHRAPAGDAQPQDACTFALPEENALYAALTALPQDERTVLYLFYFAGCTTCEIAAALGIGEGAARMRLSRARKRLHRQMEGEMTP
nr:sigma-70 family RNA polymerase sigma factor [Maliibacterium massiliense]